MDQPHASASVHAEGWTRGLGYLLIGDLETSDVTVAWRESQVGKTKGNRLGRCYEGWLFIGPESDLKGLGMGRVTVKANSMGKGGVP